MRTFKLQSDSAGIGAGSDHKVILEPTLIALLASSFIQTQFWSWIQQLAFGFALAFAETCDSLFQSLDDPKLQEIAALRMEGYTDSEIATRLNCARSTVQRRLEIIRRQCQQLEESAEA